MQLPILPLTIIALLALAGCTGDSDDQPETSSTQEGDAPSAESVAPESSTPGRVAPLHTDGEAPQMLSVITADGAYGEAANITDESVSYGGIGASNQAVELYLNGTFVGTTLSRNDGTWVLDNSHAPLAVGTHTVSLATVGGPNGDHYYPDVFSFRYDPGAPPVPVVTGILDDTNAAGDGITSDQTLIFQGTAEPDRTIEVRINGTLIGDTTSDGSGDWSFDYTDQTLAEGTYLVTARAIGTSDPSSDSAQYEVRIDLSAPSAPVISGVSPDTGVSDSDGVINEDTWTLEGSSEPGATIEIEIDGSVVDTVVADADGNWQYDQDSPLPEGSHTVRVRATDPAGNPSDWSGDFTVTIDQTPPGSVTSLTVQPDTGTAGDGITSSNELIYSGQAPANQYVEVFLDGTSVGSVAVGADGNWSLDATGSPIAEGTYSITAVTSDAAGNESSVFDGGDLTVDSGTPAAPQLLGITDDTGVDGDQVTRDPQLLIYGTAEPGTEVDVFQGGVSLGTTTTDAGGDWSYDNSANVLGDGNYPFTATARDTAGNLSPESASMTVVVDTAIAVPVVEGISDDTGTPGDGITSDNTLVVSGTAEAGAQVEVFRDGVSAGITGTDGAGNWSFDDTATTLPDGSYSYTAIATDLAGNVSGQSAGFAVTVDAQVPAAPSITDVTDDTGTAGDGVTSDTTLVFNGTSDANATVEVFVDGSAIGTDTADGSGNWSYDHSATTLAEGNYTITAVATNAAGNSSAVSGDFALTIDTSAPAPPAVTGITDDTGSDPNDGITSDTTLLFGGTSEADASVEVFIDGGAIGTTTADGSGNWSYDYTGTVLSEGSYSITAQATDTADNTSAVSTGFTVTIDTSDPVAPTVTGITDDTGADGSDGITSDTTLFVDGTSEANANVQVFIDGSAIGTTTADGSGNWSYDHTGAVLSDGSYTLTAQSTDVAGNTSAMSGGFALTIDTSVPAAPVVAGITDDTGTAGDGITSDTTLFINGTSDADASIEVFIDGGAIGTTTADGSGNWSYDHTGTALGEGTYTITAQATGAGGNSSAVSGNFALTVDTSVPAAPAVTGITDDTGADGSDGITSDTTLLFSGTSEADASVQVLIDGSPIGTTTADGSGNWSYDHTATPLAEGSYAITAQATDAAGNTSAISAGFALTIDTSATAAPVVTGISDDTGSNGSDGVTSDTTLLFSGTSEANVSVQVFIDGGAIGATTADGSGNWSYDHTGTALGEGAYTITSQATDAAGNTSAMSGGFALTIDTSDPVAPTVTGITDDTGTDGDGITSDTNLIFDGTSEAAASVQVLINGSPIGSTTADGSGDWTYDHTGTGLAEGTYTVTAVATDVAGNSSVASGDFVLTIDESAPVAPAVTGITDDTGASGSDGITSDTNLVFDGTSEADASVEVYIDGGSIGTTTADGSGDWTYDHTGTGVTEGSYTVTAVATDVAGNSSVASGNFALTVDESAPAAPAVTGITDDTGASGSDGITSDTNLVFDGTSEADASVEVFIDGGSIGTTTANGSGDWTYDHTGTGLAEGTYTVTAVATDASGNTSAVSGDFALIIDESAPAAPAVTGITDDTGASGSDGITSDTNLVFDGTSEADANVEVFIDGGSIGTTTADGSGNWSYDHTGTVMGEGSYVITAQATDAAGNASPVSGDFALNIDTSAPNAPAVTGISDDTGSNGSDGITSDTTLTLAGTSEADASVEVFIDGGSIGSTTSDGSGNWSYDHTALPLAEGDYIVIAETTDDAGNSSVASANFNLTVDTTAPSATSLVPADGATGVAFSQNLVFNADETVYVDSGNLVIREFADDSVFESIPVGDARVTGDGTATLTVNPTADLVGGTQYYVEISADAFGDLAGNGFAGFAGNSHWSFTTEDFQLTSTTPADEDTGVALDTTLTFVFNEPGSADTGNIHVRRSSDDSLFETIDVAAASVTGDGTDTLDFALGDTLEPNTAYYVEVDASAFVNTNGNAFAGISGSTSLNFTTVNVSTPTVTNVTSSATNGTYQNGETIPIQVTFSETVFVNGTPRLELTLDGASKYISYTSGTGSDTLQFNYTVQTGDSTSDLAYSSAAALVRNGGSIRSSNDANADLSLPTPGAANSLSANKDIVIDAAGLLLSDLTSDQGFLVMGAEAGDLFGNSLGSGGDINGDGYEDFVVGIRLSDLDSGDSGAAYVIFGKPGVTRTDLIVDALASDDGFIIRGGSAADYLGMTVDLSGDLNGDGYDDAVVIASNNDDSVAGGGMVYVIWGKPGSTRSDVDVSSLAPSDGFRLLPHETSGYIGSNVLNTPYNSQFLDSGDFNGDGIHDLVIGHHASDSDGSNSGLVYVIFGQEGATRSDIDLASPGSNGFRITTGGLSEEWLGHSVQFMGDFNGDGTNDLVVGAHRADGVAGDAGQAYVIFGHEGPTYSDVNLQTMSDTEGFAVQTASGSRLLGGSVGAGDVNGDGLSDLLIGESSSSGSLHVIYGYATANYPDINVDSLTVSSGFTINGITGDYVPYAVEGVGDVNGDGFDDILTSTWYEDEGGGDAGAAWLIYGKAGTARSDISLSPLDPDDGFKIVGFKGGDYLGRVNAAGDLNGDGFQDIVLSAIYGDQNGGDTGEAFVIWGKDFRSVVDSDLNGTAGADTLVGTSAGETIVGGGGADRISAGAGDDIIQVADLAFLRIDGGRGMDALELTGSSLALDLRTVAYDVIKGIEVIDLGGQGNSLTVSKSSLLALSDQVRTLYVQGDGSDWVVTDSGESWVANGTVTVNTITYNRYDLDQVSLFVEETLSQPEAPDAPSVDAFIVDTGATGDGITSDTGLVLSGTSGAYHDVEVFRDAVSIGTTTADAAGNWTFDYSGTTLTDGTYNFTAQATNLGGYTSTVSPALSVTVDASISTPVVTGITTDTGTAGDGITSDPTLVIGGTSDPGDTVEVFRGGSSIGSVTADGSGDWSFDYTGTVLGDGNYTFTAEATDTAGNTSAISAGFGVTIDTSVPGAPVVSGITDDTGTAGDGITSDTTLIFSGTSEANATVQVFIDGGAIGTTTADGSGNWSYDHTGTTLTAGAYTITAVATDAAGNSSSASGDFALTVDESAPAAPAVTGITDDTGASGSDGITSDTNLVFDGTSEANASVEVFIDGGSIGTTTADGSGDWSLDHSGTALAQNTYTITARATDAAGNLSTVSAGFDVTVDTSIAAPSVTGITSDTGVAGDGKTNDTTLFFDGTSEANASVEVFIDGGSIGTTTADGSGDWSHDHTGTTLGAGSYSITARATDVAGNLSSLSGAFAVVIDLTAPTVDSLSPADNATDVPLESDLTINFSETVSADTGDITIRRSSDSSIFEQIPVGDARVSGSGTSSITINPTSDLEQGTDYYVQVDSTALIDDVGNHYAGIADTTTWNFTSETPLLLSSSTPTDDSTGVARDSDLSLTFNRAVYPGTGDVRVRLANDGTLFEAVDVNSDQVVGGGTTTMTITFSDIFASNTDYYVEIDGTAFEDVDGEQYTGIADNTTLNFTTLTSSTPSVDFVNSSTGNGTYVSGEVIAIDVTFDETVNVTGTPRIQVDLDGQDKFINYSSGSGSSTLTFEYTVAPGDVSADLGYVDANSLILNGGTIRSDSFGNADLTLPDPGTPGSLSANQNLVVDAGVLDLNGTGSANGFTIRGPNANEEFGHALDGSGDVNGDGYEDFLFSITNYNGGGSVWLIFGKEGATRADIDLQSMTSGDGILFTGPSRMGAAAALNGDLNGDGFDDIVIADPDWGGFTGTGRLHVIWGKADIAGLNLGSGLNSADGFSINGTEANEHLTSQRTADSDDGSTANPIPAKVLDASGDFNGDGYDDLLIGHHIQDDHGENDAGRVWVILGQSGASRSNIDLGSLGTQGFYITNSSGWEGYYMGNLARFIGDYNGDGYNDILIGEIGNGGGRAYVVFGKPGTSFSNINVAALNGTDGFAITTSSAGSRLASGMDSNDINGDGLTDLVIGQQYADPNGRSDSGKVTVIYGHSNGGPYPDIDVDAISGTDGFAIQGETAGDEFGHAACVGDVDSDGIDDMVLTSRADAEGGSLAGAAWVIYGKAGTARGNIDLATLSSVDGFKIVGDAAGDEFGKYCSLADINGDGYLDLLFVSPFGDDNASNSGETNVIWGRDFQAKAFGDTTGNADVNHIVGTSAADTIDTQGGADTVSAGRGDDISYVEDVGFARVKGGRGLDTLAMAMNGLTLDLTTLGYHQLQGIEVIDLSDLNNTLVVSALDVLAMSRERSELFGGAERFVMVMGGSTDAVGDIAGAGTWTPSGSTTIGAVTYNRYVNGGATLYVEDTITQSGL